MVRGLKVVLAHFGAGWCASCAKDKPVLTKLYNSIKDPRFALEVSEDEQLAKISSSTHYQSLPYPVYWDENGEFAAA